MPTQPYFLAGKKVPSVTTITGSFKDPGPLQHWAWNIAYEVLAEAEHTLDTIRENPEDPIPKIIRHQATDPLARGDFRQASRRACTAGTLAHEMVEHWIKITDRHKRDLYLNSITLRSLMLSNPTTERSVCVAALEAIKSFGSWSKTHSFDLCQTEVPLVSKKHRYGGCIDCVGKIPDLSSSLVLFDWKTSRGIYSDYLCQIAAYKELWNENYPKTPIEVCFLCRFDKETGDFATHHFSRLDSAFEMFLCLRRAYELKSALDKRV